MLLSKVLGRKRLAVFSAAYLIGLLAANLALVLVVESGIGLDQILRGGERDGVAILDQNSRSIYTSRIPLSLAISLNKLPSVRAEALLLSICHVQGSSLVVRGVESTASYLPHLLSGSMPESEGPWIVLGRRVAERVRATIGRTIPLASSIGRTVLLLTVEAVCDFGDMKDDEALVHDTTARMLSNIPSGMVSAAIVHGLSRESVEELITRNYKVNIKCVSDLPGNLVVLEANGLSLRTFRAAGKFEESFELPFGYYTIAFQSRYLYSTLDTVLLKSDQTLEYSVRAESNPILKVASPRKPRLQRSDGVEVEASAGEGVWVFKSTPGIHRLELDSESFVIPLFHSATFDPTVLAGKTYATGISVSWGDGSPVSNYNLLVKTAEGKVVLSMLSLGGQVKADLPEGRYTIEAYSLPYSNEIALSVPTDKEVKLILPSIKSNVERLPLRYYTFVKAMPTEMLPAFTLASISGLSAALLTGLAVSIIFLFVMILATVQRYLYLSAKARLNVLSLLGASKIFFLRTIELPILAISLVLGAAASFISLTASSWLFPMLTLFGHSIPRSPALILLFSATLATLVWFWGHFALTRTVESM